MGVAVSVVWFEDLTDATWIGIAKHVTTQLIVSCLFKFEWVDMPGYQVIMW